MEHFIELVPCKRANAECIHSAMAENLTSKNIQLSKVIGMVFDGAATLSGKKSGVQATMKKHSPHDLFVHCNIGGTTSAMAGVKFHISKPGHVPSKNFH